MIGLINKAYLAIIFFALFGVYEQYEETQTNIENLQQNIEGVRNGIEKAKKERIKIDDYLKNIDIKKNEIEEVAQQIEKLQKKLPNKATDSENVSLIRRAADNLKIRDIEVNPSVEVENGFYIAKSYEVQGVGTYLQFLLLLENLATAERILNVKNLVIERSEQKIKGRYDVLRMSATIESYRYNDAFKEDRGIEAVESEFKKATTVTPAGTPPAEAAPAPAAGGE